MFLSRFIPTFNLMMASQFRVVVYGGKGALGAAIVDHFKSCNWVSKDSNTCMVSRDRIFHFSG